MKVRLASVDDLTELYEIGKNTPELKVSATDEFMELDELKWAITNPDGVFLVAEKDGNIVGFEYANIKEMGQVATKQACLVYIVVIPEFRKHGIAQALYSECEKKLKEKGVNYLYCWANLEGKKEIVEFRKKNGFTEGHKYMWMDKKLD